MNEPPHPLPNLAALKSKLDAGLASDLVDALRDARMMDEVTRVLSAQLRARVATIEEETGAASEVA